MDFSLNGLKKIILQKGKKHSSNRRSTFLLSSSNVPFAFEEAYKATRTNIIFSLADKTAGCKTVVVTSAIPTEGKTTICLNLAISFAQTEDRVLVIDADLRKPKIHTYLKSDNKVGLTNVLAGMADVKNVIKKDPSGFDYMTSGHIPPNPVELLSSKKMKDLLEQLSQSYDYIFIDTPPITIVTDASSVAKDATGVILVAKYMYTTRENLEKAISNLKFVGANIMGLMLNDSDHVRRKIYKKAYKKSYYKYNRDYTYEYSYSNWKSQDSEESE